MNCRIKASALLGAADLTSALLAPLALPLAATVMYARKKYRAQLPWRMGKLPGLKTAPHDGPVIWVHALSVGEVNAVLPLVKKMQERWKGACLVCSASTSSGMVALEKRLGRTGCALAGMPFDVPVLRDRVIRHVSPHCFLLVETDIWPGFVWALKRRGIPALLINGSISSRAAARLGSLERAGIEAAGLLYGGFHTVAMQSDDDLGRLESAGMPPWVHAVSAGNLKFDIEIPCLNAERKAELRTMLGIDDRADLVITAGSTHPGEEKAVLRGLLRILASSRSPDRRTGLGVRLIVAPRDIERGGELARLASAMGLKAWRKSLGPVPRDKGPFQVVVLDTLGELQEVYSISHIAFVGGSLAPVGGHNLFEPAMHGVPVIWGPHVESCSDMARVLLASGGGCEVNSAAELENVLLMLASDPALRKEAGRNAERVVMRNRGAVDNYMELVAGALGPCWS